MAGNDEAPTAVVVRPAATRDLAAINRIYNYEVLHGTATWDEAPWTPEQRRAWFAGHDASTPVLVAEIGGEVAGFAYLSRYRAKAGYRFTREDTLYVDAVHQRRGVGAALLGALLDEARRGGMHAVVAVIETQNAASIALHRRFGFRRSGVLHEVGFKFGRWLDSVEMELLLAGGAG